MSRVQHSILIILVFSSPTSRSSAKAPITSFPVTLRFDAADGTQSKVHFSSSSEAELEELLRVCSPATFGFQGQDVLDESYRKAGKLDRENFCSSFHPYDYGVVDAIAQTLLPNVRRMIEDKALMGAVNADHLGVIAELYKLNVYSGPSGRFRKHVVCSIFLY